MKTLGIDLGGTNLRAAVLNEGILEDLKKFPVIKSNGKNGIVEQIIDLVNDYLEHSIEGIGIGVPSYVDINTGTVYDTLNLPGWDNVPLKQILESRFEIPVMVNNDSNCFAIGEKYFGKGSEFDSFVGLTLGTGLGTGIFINGKLHEGASCCAGEIGELPYLDMDYEHYASNRFFSKIHGTNSLEVYNLAREGNLDALALYEEFGHHVGSVLILLMLTYDPEAIILGGSVVKAWPFFSSSMEEVIQTTPYRLQRQRMKIITSTLEFAGIYGAAQMLIDSKLKPIPSTLKS